MNLRLVTCDIKGCTNRHEERAPGDGFPGWGQLSGIILDGNQNPMLCPEHLGQVAMYADGLSKRGEA
jgi:hypothetical protein